MNLSSGMSGFYYIFGLASSPFRCQLPPDVWPDDDQYHAINDTHQHLINEFLIPSNWEYTNGSQCNEFTFDRSNFGKPFTEATQLIYSHIPKKAWIFTIYETGTYEKIILTICVEYTYSALLSYMFTVLITGHSLAHQSAYVWYRALCCSFFLLIIELRSSSHTTFATGVSMVAYILGEILFIGFTYSSRHWLSLECLINAYYTVTIPYLYFIPDSSYWLFSQKKYNELESCLRKYGKSNKREESE